VKVLEEKSNSTAEENLSLVKSLNELDTRVQALEAKAAPGEVSMAQMVKGFA
jgi:peptidoglycan hydrolase CwlO-like protein